RSAYLELVRRSQACLMRLDRSVAMPTLKEIPNEGIERFFRIGKEESFRAGRIFHRAGDGAAPGRFHLGVWYLGNHAQLPAAAAGRRTGADFVLYRSRILYSPDATARSRGIVS